MTTYVFPRALTAAEEVVVIAGVAVAMGVTGGIIEKEGKENMTGHMEPR